MYRINYPEPMNMILYENRIFLLTSSKQLEKIPYTSNKYIGQYC